MRRGKEDRVGARTEKGAGGLANARRNAVAIATLQIQNVNLVKRIARLAFALENEAIAIGRKITLTTAAAIENKLTGIGEESSFGQEIGIRSPQGWDEKECQQANFTN